MDMASATTGQLTRYIMLGIDVDTARVELNKRLAPPAVRRNHAAAKRIIAVSGGVVDRARYIPGWQKPLWPGERGTDPRPPMGGDADWRERLAARPANPRAKPLAAPRRRREMPY